MGMEMGLFAIMEKTCTKCGASLKMEKWHTEGLCFKCSGIRPVTDSVDVLAIEARLKELKDE